jgi:hypothetical protein
VARLDGRKGSSCTVRWRLLWAASYSKEISQFRTLDEMQSKRRQLQLNNSNQRNRDSLLVEHDDKEREKNRKCLGRTEPGHVLTDLVWLIHRHVSHITHLHTTHEGALTD